MKKDTDQGSFERLGETLGGMAGRTAGRATDMAMDAAGTAMNVAGSIVGSLLRRMGPWWSGPQAARATETFSEEQDRACREHFESKARSGGSGYESARPLYQFGHVAGHNPEYQGKAFDDVEAELQRKWEAAAREGFGDWNEVRDYVNYGYTSRVTFTPD
jgi:hypothetical protein